MFNKLGFATRFKSVIVSGGVRIFFESSSLKDGINIYSDGVGGFAARAVSSTFIQYTATQFGNFLGNGVGNSYGNYIIY